MTTQKFLNNLNSEKAGISMNQWFTGYFERFAKHGHGTYHELYQELIEDK